LLTLARELRYVSLRTFQHLATYSVSEVDSLLTGLSKTYYLIALIAPEDSRRLASDLRESIFKLWGIARDNPESDQYPPYLAEVRDLAEKFRVHVTAELNLTEVASEQNLEIPRKPNPLL
jgi:hypothetical protein